MDKARTVELLNDTFTTNFNFDQFSKFTKELFNEIRINVQDKTQYIANQFKEYIAECKKIAEYKDSSKKSMEILAVKLKRTSSRDRARTMQRNFISSWLSKLGIDAALVAFYSDDNEDWRFSYIKMEYNLVKNEDDKVVIKKELTPAKRYSFLVGINEPNHTCQRQFLELVMKEKTNPSILEIEQAFSIEKVTKEFFEKYKELAINLKESMDKRLIEDTHIKTEFDRKGITTINFSKKLLGQIVFIYFLQKKGWLGVQKKADGTFDEWGTGPKKFLRQLFDKKIVPYDNFFNDMLEPLFYEALANDRSADNDYYSRFKCKIPFLNGGLFEPLNDYDWTGTDIKIPNELFSNSIKTQAGDIGTGILDVFDRYNFTVKEDEPLEKEVAVDPEMLGKVFENLLEVKERKDKGAFYTPREIVHYMCQQSLINYLETNTNGVPREDIERFIQCGDIALDQTVRSRAQKEIYHGKSYVDEKLLIPKSIAGNYQKIDTLLQDIKIVDPAVGSGAFPVGMMNEIVKARSILTLFFLSKEQESRTEYNLKRQCIENCLYGVDIDPSAVEIAKLRFWLSLIVDEEKKEDIQPLPNLDHKIMCGNSLLEEFEGIKLFDERLLGEIAVKTPTEVEIDGINEQILKLNDELKDIKFGDQRPEIKQKIEQRETLKKKKETLEKRLEKEKHQKDKDVQITIDQAMEHKIKESQIKLSKLKKLQKEFFNEQNRNKKKKLREEIDKIEWELIEAALEEQGHEEAMAKLEQYKKVNVKPFFLWKLYFAEVFQRENPGFDVVIANPPYVDSENMVKNMPTEREILSVKYETAKGNWDLYIPFFEAGFNFCRECGHLTYIAPNKWLSIGYGKKLRDFLIDYVYQLCNCDSVKVFEAGNTPEIVYIKKTKSDMGVKIHTFNHDYMLISKGIVPRSVLSLGNWGMILSEHLKLLLKVLNTSNHVEDFCNVENPFTVSEAYELKPFVYNGDNIDGGDLKLINTGTIDKYVSLWGYKTTAYIKDKYQFPFVNAGNFRKLLPKRYAQSVSKKIIISGIRYFECFLDNDGKYVAGKSTIIIRNVKENIGFKTLLAILNSSLMSFYIREAYSATGIGGGVNFTAPMIKALPIPNIDNDTILNGLVDEIIKTTSGEYYEDDHDKSRETIDIMNKIDSLIYERYNLSDIEIKVIEDYKQASLGVPIIEDME